MEKPAAGIGAESFSFIGTFILQILPLSSYLSAVEGLPLTGVYLFT